MYSNTTSNNNKVNKNTNNNNDNSLNNLNLLTDLLNTNTSHHHIDFNQFKMEPFASLQNTIAFPASQTPLHQNHISLLLNKLPNPQMHALASTPLMTHTNNILLFTPNGLLSLPTSSPSLHNGIDINTINTMNTMNTFNTINTINNITTAPVQNPLQSLFPSIPINLIQSSIALPSIPSIRTAAANIVPTSFPSLSTRNFHQDLPPKLDSASIVPHQQSVHISKSPTNSNTNSSEFVNVRNHTNNTLKMESEHNDTNDAMDTNMDDDKSDVDPLRCNGCNKKYTNEKDLLQHLNETKTDNKKAYACTKCCKSFTRLGNLNNHNRTHSQSHSQQQQQQVPLFKKSESPSSISIPPAVNMDTNCDSDKNKHIIMSEHNRLKIERANNVTSKPFKCDECNKAFRNKSGLSNHRIIHNGQKPHKCTFSGCGKSFARSCDLTRHIRLHTGYKPFKCQYKSCKKSFTRSVQLRLHLMDHTGQRPFKCDICMKGFKTLQNAQIHMRIHTGEKPYACTYCKKRFTQSSSLKTHLSSIHSEE